eukprot:jgi/Botrbrau1/1417/Bobra.0063s0113.1
MIISGQPPQIFPCISNSNRFWGTVAGYGSSEAFYMCPSAGVYFTPDELGSRLLTLIQAIVSRWSGGALALCQIWKPLIAVPGAEGSSQQGAIFGCHGLPFAVGNAQLQGFRLRSCELGITAATLGMLNKVAGGCIQVIQNVTALPSDVHPRNKLNGSLHAVGELVYIPVYDRLQVGGGLVAILEILLPANVAESMLVANMISYVSAIMDTLNLSLSSPAAEPPPAVAPRQSPPPQQGNNPSDPSQRRSLSRCASVRGSVADMLTDALTAEANSSPSPTPPAKRLLSLA